MIMENVDFEKKMKRLMKRANEYIFMNAAISDELTEIREKISKVSDERNYLIQKLLQKQSQLGPAKKISEAGGQKGSTKSVTGTRKRKPPAKKVVQNNNGDNEGDDDGHDNSSAVPKKRQRANHQSSQNPSLPQKASLAPLDSSGRPIFPIELGTLTVYSIGEIITVPNYHSSECIYPIGFCSTRLYISVDPNYKTGTYTCKVTDSGDTPKFEILSEGPVRCNFIGTTPDQCHLKLLNHINNTRGAGSVPTTPNGASFFGLIHPTLKNLVQCFPGARKCSDYNWVKFEVTKDYVHVEQDPSVNINFL